MVHVRGVLMALLATTTGTSVVLAAQGSYEGVVTPYQIDKPDIGSCRLKGIDQSSDNFKNFASVSATVATLNEGCGRCVKISKEGGTSLTAYVLDVCQGCKTSDIKLSKSALSSLAIDPNSNNVKVSYKFVTCPTSFLSGNIKACLMEGASNTYIPLQFYNSQKVIKEVQISGQPAQQQKDSFFFYVSPQKPDGAQWFKQVSVALTSTDGETKNGTLEFSGSQGCAATQVQFSAASTADGDSSGDGAGGSGKGSGSSSGGLIAGILGGVAVLLLVVGSIIFVRRRRAANDDGHDRDMENQYLSPVQKPGHQGGDDRPTHVMERSHHDTNSAGTMDDGEYPDSPAHAFEDASTPAAGGAVAAYNMQPSNPRAAAPAPTATAPPSGPPSRKYKYNAPPSYSFSKPPEQPRRTAPQQPAPRLDEDDESDGRGSFDVDDIRSTQEFKEEVRFSSFNAPYSSDSAYASSSVTSPQSYVRATALRRNSSKNVRDGPKFAAPTVPSHSFSSDASYQDNGDRRQSMRSTITEAQF